MQHIIILCVFIVVLLLLLRDAPFYFQSKSLPGYDKHEVSEAFESSKKEDKLEKTEKTEDPLFAFQPGSGEPVDLHNGQPYHLLSDEMGMPREKEALSCVTSRSCYASDFQRILEKNGSFRQLTNNYKRGYPDSCSGLQQELTMNFYKTRPF
uniref:Uncharacterized protein n=1 Tax=viral metagenome TaxID=1070528 RepID=A0A6C0IHS7_9ZZZZ